MTLLYITATYDYHIGYVHCACLQGSGCNSYQAMCIESGEFWRVLGRSHVRHQWKHNIVDTFTHHICTNGHGGTIGTGFPYIRWVDRRTLAPVQYIVLSSLLHWQLLLYSLNQALNLSTRWALDLVCCALHCTTGYGPCTGILVIACHIEQSLLANTRWWQGHSLACWQWV